MADRLTNIELLLMLSEDVKADNQDWSREVHAEGRARYQKVTQLLERIEQAKILLEDERKWLAHYAPRPQEAMPKIATQGPRTDDLIQRKANS
jgi:hypothetical protein